MYRLLTGPLCGWPSDCVTMLAEPESPGDLPDRLVELFGQARDVALFYYVGHGQVDFEDQLCLGLVGSRVEPERRATTSLTFESVRRSLRASSAATKVVILDCCFAGQAVQDRHTLAGAGAKDITGLASASGAYTLAATGPASTAWFESGADSPLPHTHFTRALVDTVIRGIQGEPAALTLDPIYRQLREGLSAEGKPVPTRISRHDADAFVFARNAAPSQTHAGIEQLEEKMRLLQDRLAEFERRNRQAEAERAEAERRGRQAEADRLAEAARSAEAELRDRLAEAERMRDTAAPSSPRPAATEGPKFRPAGKHSAQGKEPEHAPVPRGGMRDMTQPRLLGGRYELDGVVGRGGMAEVYRARDLRLDRVVAIKTLREDLARDQTFQARFRREAQSAASLNHPSIVAVYDTGEDNAGRSPVPYIVMEYVDGRTLRDLLRDDRRLLPERALEITDGVLRALDYSHRNGIVHRDIKPGDVMLTRDGQVKVMDFGVARAVSDAQATMTQTAQVIGTAQYLSPELARGERVDARSDLYSTGCLLYELLTGRPPFTGDSPVAIAYQHVRENPIPPSRIDPEIPPWADTIVLRAMAKAPKDRYQSAAEMRADIQRALSGMMTGAAPAPVPAPKYNYGAIADYQYDEPARRPLWRRLLDRGTSDGKTSNGPYGPW
jgi:tRNA A-37 threonylcarbamoyl transferase component Bud32